MTTRQAFEEWAISTGHSVERIAEDPSDLLSGQYKSAVTNTRWHAWQAATAAALERAAKTVESSAYYCGGLELNLLKQNAAAIRALKDES